MAEDPEIEVIPYIIYPSMETIAQEKTVIENYYTIHVRIHYVCIYISIYNLYFLDPTVYLSHFFAMDFTLLF